MENMLSQALRGFLTGPLNQLIVNLGGSDGEVWEDEFKRFLRKEPCWTNGTEDTAVVRKQSDPQPILRFVDMVAIPARTKPFVPKASYIVNTKRGSHVKIGYVDPDFTAWFGEKVEQPTAEIMFRRHILVSPSVFAAAMKEVEDAGFVTETTPSQLFSMLEQQPDGPKSQPGPLLTNGFANLFKMIDVNGVARLVDARWCDGDDGWSVCADATSRSYQWSDEDRLFSSDSRLPSAA